MTELRTVGPARPDARIRLVCLPYAGGGANVFTGWHQGLPVDVEVCAPVLPGREGLLHRPPIERLEDYVRALDEAIADRTGARPYALFGHSFGAVVAYELAWFRFRARRPLPEVLIVAGREPPSTRPPERRMADLPTDQFIQALARLDGTPQELLVNEELMQMLLPALRADCRMSEDYRAPKRPRLPVPVVALTGRDDREVSPRRAAGWADCTQAGFRVVVLGGGHFFVRDRRDEVLAEITRSLNDAVPPMPARRSAAPSA